MTFRLVRAENLFGINEKDCDPLRRSELGARVMPRQKKGMELVCRGAEIMEARPEGLLIQHHGAAGVCNLRAMINSSMRREAETSAVCAMKGSLVLIGVRAC